MQLLGMLFFITVLSQTACAPPEGAPFPEEIRFSAPGQFLFRAQGNWAHPANTASGEKTRLSWLDDYLSRSHLCPSGYEILQRIPERLKMSPKIDAEDQQLRWITYVGNCSS
jgi:hypothetical protein